MRFLLLVLITASVAFAAPKKKKTPPTKPASHLVTEAAIKKTFDAAQEKVGACVLDNAGTAPFTLTVKAKIDVNSAGQLLGTRVTITPEGEAAEKTRRCIDGVLQGLAWPKSQAPMISAEREWSFSTESK